MKIVINRKFCIVTAVMALVLAASMHMFTIGYGVGYQSRGRAMLALKQAKEAQKYAPSHLTIHYEQQHKDKRDILRLEVDTIYRSIGKGAFSYEIICDRRLALQSASGERFSAEAAKLCFVEGASRQWTKINRHKSIHGYNCWESIAHDEKYTWQAWYTTELPHCADGATVTDGLNGIILMLQDGKGEYTLRATTIDVKIG